MSQHDFDIANQSASSARADINNALKALASLSSGSTAPSTTYANMLWYETDTNTLKMRAEADDAWISIGYLNQSTDTFALFDDTKVVNSGGTQTGLLGDQSTAVWEAGTGTTESLVSPAKVKAAIDKYTIGQGQTWSDVSSGRSLGVSYQNTSDRPIEIAAQWESGASTWRAYLNVSSDGSSWLRRGFSYHGSVPDETECLSTIVPPNSYYRIGSNTDGTGSSNGTSLMFWLELS